MSTRPGFAAQRVDCRRDHQHGPLDQALIVGTEIEYVEAVGQRKEQQRAGERFDHTARATEQRGAPENGGRDHGELITLHGGRIDRSETASEEHAGKTRRQARKYERTDLVGRDVDTGQARGLGIAAHRVNTSAENREGQDEPHNEGEGRHVENGVGNRAEVTAFEAGHRRERPGILNHQGPAVGHDEHETAHGRQSPQRDDKGIDAYELHHHPIEKTYGTRDGEGREECRHETRRVHDTDLNCGGESRHRCYGQIEVARDEHHGHRDSHDRDTRGLIHDVGQVDRAEVARSSGDGCYHRQPGNQ
jgi:hypothetical protein